MRGLVAAVAAFLWFAVACSPSAKLQSKEAIRSAIEGHLKQRQSVMLANMSLEVGEVKFTDDTADAEVQFRSKQSPDVVVSVHYKLRQAGDHWQVESSTPTSGMGTSPHGGAAPATPAPSHGETSLESSH